MLSHLSLGTGQWPVLTLLIISHRESRDDASPAKRHAAPTIAMGSCLSESSIVQGWRRVDGMDLTQIQKKIFKPIARGECLLLRRARNNIIADVPTTFVKLGLDSTVDTLHACSAKRVLSISPYSIIRLRRVDTFTPRFGCGPGRQNGRTVRCRIRRAKKLSRCRGKKTTPGPFQIRNSSDIHDAA